MKRNRPPGSIRMKRIPRSHRQLGGTGLRGVRLGLGPKFLMSNDEDSLIRFSLTRSRYAEELCFEADKEFIFCS